MCTNTIVFGVLKGNDSVFCKEMVRCFENYFRSTNGDSFIFRCCTFAHFDAIGMKSRDVSLRLGGPWSCDQPTKILSKHHRKTSGPEPFRSNEGQTHEETVYRARTMINHAWVPFSVRKWQPLYSREAIVSPAQAKKLPRQRLKI